MPAQEKDVPRKSKRAAKPSIVTQRLIQQIMALLGQVADKFEPGADEIKAWMTANLGTSAVIDLLHDTTITSFRVLNVVGKQEPVNGITISRQSGVPKGSVSKATRRLIAQRLITSEPLPNNQKEIRYRLTSRGRELYEAHRAFDAYMEKRFITFLERYDADDLALIVRVLQDLSGTN
jgi:DNA-binding MarR family transcriptional regulator